MASVIQLPASLPLKTGKYGQEDVEAFDAKRRTIGDTFAI